MSARGRLCRKSWFRDNFFIRDGALGARFTWSHAGTSWQTSRRQTVRFGSEVSESLQERLQFGQAPNEMHVRKRGEGLSSVSTQQFISLR
jgi:hypothetical protein